MIAKKLNDILKKCLFLNNLYNTQNSTTLANSLVKLNINKHRLITFDIKDLYVNILTKETIEITKEQLLKNNDKQLTK
jgi:homospermidine synthase